MQEQVHKASDLDPALITRYGFDEKRMAHRMVVLNELPQINVTHECIEQPIREIKNTEVKVIEIEKPVIIKETVFKEIEKPIFIEKWQIEKVEVQVPTIIKEKEVEFIKVPEIIKEKEIVFVDKPFEVVKTETKHVVTQVIPNWVWMVMGSQLLITILVLFFKR